MGLDEFDKAAPAITAIVAVIVGPLLQWRIARRQTADNISAKRQVWIDELRRDIAAFLQTAAKLEGLRRPNLALPLEDQKKTFEERVEADSKANELGLLIRMRLNPDEPAHNKLVELLVGLAALCPDPPSDETEADRLKAKRAFHAQQAKIVAHTQSILKTEWDRIKRGEVD